MVWLVKMKEMQYKIILKELFFMIYNRTIKTRSEGYEKDKKSIRLSNNHCVNFLWITEKVKC